MKITNSGNVTIGFVTTKSKQNGERSIPSKPWKKEELGVLLTQNECANSVGNGLAPIVKKSAREPNGGLRRTERASNYTHKNDERAKQGRQELRHPNNFKRASITTADVAGSVEFHTRPSTTLFL